MRLFKAAWDSKFRRGRAPSSPQCPHCHVHHRADFVCFLYMLPGHRNSMCAEAWAASGLPDPEARVTARDIALLALSLIERFPDHLDMFAKRSVRIGKRRLPTGNGLLAVV